jgi:hypothetical protein
MITSSETRQHRTRRTAAAMAAVGAVLGAGGLVGLAGPAQAAGLPAGTATTTAAKAVTVPINKADVQVKITGPHKGNENTAYTFTVTSWNSGPAAADLVTNAVELPAGATLVSASGSYVQVGPRVEWQTLPSLRAHDTSSYEITVTFSGRGMTAVEAMSMSQNPQDPRPSNNTAYRLIKIS